jgi:hypothetical protein
MNSLVFAVRIDLPPRTTYRTSGRPLQVEQLEPLLEVLLSYRLTTALRLTPDQLAVIASNITHQIMFAPQPQQAA